ncbi:MAG: formylglycine-generating enzyme family protein, partial [Deltaproteobacteria bacterium]|nr:formylglycine-generating enzyme family protein [Deltaproteobacteria bacterium]
QNPVEQVSLEDVQGFLQELNAEGGPDKAGEYKRVYALPTEAQWEYGCRAGSSKRFCFGDSDGDLGQYAWYGSNSGSETHAVGGKKANGWVLHDMHGNVWEWCQDRYGSYETVAQTDLDPKGPGAGTSRVLRGGYWSYYPAICRSASRDGYGPVYRISVRGVRLVVVPGALR